MKIKRKVQKELKEQAQEIMYFEASMSNENNAVKMLTERLEEIYRAGYEAGVANES